MNALSDERRKQKRLTIVFSAIVPIGAFVTYWLFFAWGFDNGREFGLLAMATAVLTVLCGMSAAAAWGRVMKIDDNIARAERGHSN